MISPFTPQNLDMKRVSRQPSHAFPFLSQETSILIRMASRNQSTAPHALVPIHHLSNSQPRSRDTTFMHTLTTLHGLSNRNSMTRTVGTRKVPHVTYTCRRWFREREERSKSPPRNNFMNWENNSQPRCRYRARVQATG